MLGVNIDKLVRISVTGEVSSPIFWRSPYRISTDGKPVVLLGVGEITCNMWVGDLASGWEADHAEPGVGMKNKESEDANMALSVLVCVENEAIVVSADAK